MALKKIVVFKGEKSQTGLAASLRFPGLKFEGGKELFSEITKILKTDEVLAILPVWNSHEGEIPKTNILEAVFTERTRIQELWPKQISFECIQRAATKRAKKNIISAGVAKTQCSDYLKGCNFKKADSTVDAVEDFFNDTKYDAVLCPPRTYEELKHKGGFIKDKDDVSNPFNFTTFALLGNAEKEEWKGKKWKILREYGLPKLSTIYGVEMSIPEQALAEDQHELLDDIMQNAKSVDQIPKIIFICKRSASRCGMLIESNNAGVSAPLHEKGGDQDIVIKQDLGATNKPYSDSVISLIHNNFTKHLSSDFIKHIGTQTCLYACPELNILTHGFDQEAVEKIVRRVINKYFELLDLGLSATSRQKRFFRKHYTNYKKKGPHFIKFISVLNK